MAPVSTTDRAIRPGFAWVRVCIVLLAAAFRLWALDLRPPHFDEGVNGMFTDTMQHTGFYHYDPTNYHGPLHFYILFLFKCLLGRSLWALRLPEALAGIFTVDWVFRFTPFFGRRVCAWTALAMAVSPGFTFFNRYAIHETWLVLFMLIGCWGVFTLWRDGTRPALWATIMGLAGMVLTKETYVIHLAGLALAVIALLAVEVGVPWISRRPFPRLPQPTSQLWRWTDLCAALSVAVAANLFFYSGGGYNWGGVADMVRTFEPWAHKANVGEGHNKPFWYWSLGLTWHKGRTHLVYAIRGVLVRNEPWAFAGLLASFRYALAPSAWGRPLRLLAFYALAAFFAYSAIPYKTPWCVVSIAWPFLFLGAAGVVDIGTLLAKFGGLVTALIAAALSIGSAWLAWDLNFYRYTDETENYVYVHTYNDVWEITGPLYDIASEDPTNYRLVGTVLCDSVHPIPWLLGDFSRVGYYTKASAKRRSPNYNADFLIVSQDQLKNVEPQLKDAYFKQTLHLRPSLTPIVLYLRASIFGHLMPEREPEFKPGAHSDETPSSA